MEALAVVTVVVQLILLETIAVTGSAKIKRRLRQSHKPTTTKIQTVVIRHRLRQ